MKALDLGTIINHAYQAGENEATLRAVALSIRAQLDPSERNSFTDAIEMSGLWLDGDY